MTTDSLSFEWELRHPPAKVWRALTDPALLAEWLLPVVGLDLAPGTTFRFKKKLSYTWVVGDMDTVVTFTLTPTPSGTRLSLLHTGFKPTQQQNLGGARYGWKMMSDKLDDLLGRTP